MVECYSTPRFAVCTVHGAPRFLLNRSLNHDVMISHPSEAAEFRPDQTVEMVEAALAKIWFRLMGRSKPCTTEEARIGLYGV